MNFQSIIFITINVDFLQHSIIVINMKLNNLIK
jgi:hypothetical protein